MRWFLLTRYVNFLQIACCGFAQSIPRMPAVVMNTVWHAGNQLRCASLALFVNYLRSGLVFLSATSLYGLTLQEAEMRAMQSSPAVQLGNLQAEQNAAQYVQAFLSWFPDITYGSMVAFLEKSQKISHLQKQKFIYSNQFTLTQPIFSSSLLSNLQIGRIIKEGGEVGKELAINETLYLVRTHYLQFGLKTRKADLENVNLAFLQKTFQDQEVLLKSGRSTQLQVAKAKAAISHEMIQELNSKKEALKARHELAILLRLSSAEESELAFTGFPSLDDYPILKEKQKLLQTYLVQNTLNRDPPSTLLFKEDETEQMVAQAKANRPELKKSSLLVEAANAKSKESRMQYLPEVSAFVDYGYYQPINGQFFRQRNDWAGGIQLSWSLFDSLKREMKSKEVAAFRKAAKLAYGFDSERLNISIRQDLRDIEEALFIYQNAQENLYLSQKTFEESEVQHAAGSLSDLQLQDAKRFLAESEYGQSEALAALLQKYYQLQHDIGYSLK